MLNEIILRFYLKLSKSFQVHFSPKLMRTVLLQVSIWTTTGESRLAGVCLPGVRVVYRPCTCLLPSWVQLALLFCRAARLPRGLAETSSGRDEQTGNTELTGGAQERPLPWRSKDVVLGVRPARTTLESRLEEYGRSCRKAQSTNGTILSFLGTFFPS